MTGNSKIFMYGVLYVRRVTGITRQNIFPWRKQNCSSIFFLSRKKTILLYSRCFDCI